MVIRSANRAVSNCCHGDKVTEQLVTVVMVIRLQGSK